MVSFDNTEIAFRNKSDAELKRAYRLFKLVGNNWLVSFGKWATNVALTIRFPIKGIVKATIFKQFCGGETIAECEQTITRLWQSNVGTILDYSVEGKDEDENFEFTCQEVLATIARAYQDPSIPISVFKLTAITSFALLEKLNMKEELTPEEERRVTGFYDRLDRICKAAEKADTPVFIDAEESWIQEAIDEAVESMMRKYNKRRAIVYNTVQLYRHDRLEYIKMLQADSGDYFLGLKLVRGAYMEKERARADELGYPSPIQPNKEACDKDYNLALEFCTDHIDRISFCAGTHNEESSLHLIRLMEERNIAKNDNRIHFAQLLGMSDHISFNLSDAGYNVAKYVPYGPVKEVLPYLIRRAEENTSVSGQTSRELSLIMKERKRRKQLK